MGILPMDHGLEARATSSGHFGNRIAAIVSSSAIKRWKELLYPDTFERTSGTP